MANLTPSEVAAGEGLGQLRVRYPGTWFAQALVAVMVALFTGLIGFLGDITAYKIGGSLTVLALIVWSVMIAKNKGFWEYDNGFLQVDALGRVRAHATWQDVIVVRGVRVDVTNGAFTVERRDFVIDSRRGQIKFNDLLVHGGAHFAVRVAQMSAAARGY